MPEDNAKTSSSPDRTPVIGHLSRQKAPPSFKHRRPQPLPEAAELAYDSTLQPPLSRAAWLEPPRSGLGWLLIEDGEIGQGQVGMPTGCRGSACGLLPPRDGPDKVGYEGCRNSLRMDQLDRKAAATFPLPAAMVIRMRSASPARSIVASAD
jgi:hypothetical protein